MNKTNLFDFRKNYSSNSLIKKDLDQNPFIQFQKWFEEAKNTEMLESNAMCLATVGINGQPSSRMLLLKSFDLNGFIFFTNYDSKKGLEIKGNPLGAILFFWDLLEREIRIEGKISKISALESDEYFDSRPLGSKIGALISKQSYVINDDDDLKKEKKKNILDFENKKISRPENWGGYILIPNLFEFWQGQPDRLHDRFQYKLENNNWLIERLSP
jgi:pyridoxamine 5'-phosphate oxidase